MKNTDNRIANLENATVTAPEAFNFKSAKLNELSAKIATVGKNMADSNIQLAKLLGEVLETKCYTEDGFRSVSEYAEQTFNIKKSLAYQLASVGARFYLKDSDAAREVAAMLPPSNLAELVSMTDEQLAEAVKDGTVSAGKTQKQLRDIAKAAKPAKPRVLKEYEVEALVVVGNRVDHVHFDHITTDGVVQYLENQRHFSNIKTVSAEHGVLLFVYSDNTDFARVELVKPYTPAKEATKTKKPKFTKEQLLAMLAEMDD